jgi:hypothetical protein
VGDEEVGEGILQNSSNRKGKLQQNSNTSELFIFENLLLGLGSSQKIN